MKRLQISDRNIMSIAIQQEISRSEEARYDHRLHGALLVSRGLSYYRVGELFGQQIVVRNSDFFVLGITWQTNNFHAIKQRRWDIHAVSRSDKHDIRQIEIHFQVMISERVVLFRIEHFEQRRGGITPEVCSHLVYFIQQKQRITGTHLAQVLNDLAW